MENLPKFTIKFLYWYLVKSPKKLNKIFYRLALLVNNEASFTLNLKLIFTPLYGDYSLIGRFIGFILRIIFILSGSIFVISLLVLCLIIPILWYIVPAILIYFLGFWSIPIFLSIFLYIFYINMDVPDYRINKIDIKNKNIQNCMRQSTKNFYQNISKKNTYWLNQFLIHKHITFLLYKSELQGRGFEEKLSRITTINYDQILQKSFGYAQKFQSRYIDDESLFVGIIASISNVDAFLSGFDTNLDALEKTAYWIISIREQSAKNYFWQDDFVMPAMAGFGKGLTGRVTPHLDAISEDFTLKAQRGRLKNIVGRDNEIEKIAQFLSGANDNILLVGAPGCGKTSLVMGLAHKIVHGTDYKTLQNKRIVSIDLGSMIAGIKTSGDVAQRLKSALDEAVLSRDIILFVDEINTLASAISENGENSSIYSLLEPYLSSNNLQFIGATTIENYRKHIEPFGSFSRLFEMIEIGEPSAQDTLEIIKYVALKFEHTYNVVVTLPALTKIIKLSEKLIHDRVLPDKAIDVLNRACKKAATNTKYVTSKEIEKEISDMTHIPSSILSEDESEKLLNIASEMKKYVIGQDYAIDKISSALIRARAGIRDENKPIASFLFVGTTGVGKTETAKTLSATYFGDKKSMIRLDMSEYQTANSIDKLIGTADGKTKGLLTEQIRTKPFTVLLLDEIEKAHPQILLTFLQVLDDARLTDSFGKTADFTNSIIIATSNVGTKKIQEITQSGGDYKEIETEALKKVREQFAPEFLNRFTAIIVFNPLTPENIRKVAELLLTKVKKIAEEKNIKLEIKGELINELIKRGYSREWGARPMARLIEDTIETYLAQKIISKEIKAGDSLSLGLEVFKD